MPYRNPHQVAQSHEYISLFVTGIDEPVTIDYVMGKTNHSYRQVREVLLNLHYVTSRITNPKGRTVTVWYHPSMNRTSTELGWCSPPESWACMTNREVTVKEKKKEEEPKDKALAYIQERLKELRLQAAELSKEEAEEALMDVLTKIVTTNRNRENINIFLGNILYVVALRERELTFDGK